MANLWREVRAGYSLHTIVEIRHTLKDKGLTELSPSGLKIHNHRIHTVIMPFSFVSWRWEFGAGVGS